MPRTDIPAGWDERTVLTTFLDYVRATVHAKCEHLAEADARRAPLPGSPLMTLAGLVNHLRWVEYFWFQVMLLGEEDHGPWTEEDPDREMRIAVAVPIAQLLDEYEAQCRRYRGLAPLCETGPLRPAEPPHLLAYLATIHDPRRACGRRHPLVAILAMAAAAVLAGARSMTAIAEWAADTPQPVRAALGARRDAPDRWVVPAEATIRRALGRVDPTALAAVIGAWLTDRDHPGLRRRAVAVDGKTLRGARRDGRQVHLLAAMDHASRAVLAQRHVNGAPGEIPGFASLLANLDLAGTVVTADALHTHAGAAELLVTGKQAHYLFTVKANQPTLLDRCTRLAWHQVPVLDRTRDRAHGRIGIRTLKVVSVGTFGFPHVAQVLQITRRTRNLRSPSRRWRTVVVYAVTSLPHAQAGPGRLADLIRGRWAIEICQAGCAYGM